jgi:8-oxo-dGTP diphosphatase
MPLRPNLDHRDNGAIVDADSRAKFGGRAPLGMPTGAICRYGRGMAKVLQVVAAVIQDGEQFLACRRSPWKVAGGRWEFPGGKIEDGESAAEALRREIKEELAIDIHVLGELTTNDTSVDDLTIRLTCLLAHIDGPRPSNSTDHDLLEWVAADDLHRLDWADPDLPAVKLLTARGA